MLILYRVKVVLEMRNIVILSLSSTGFGLINNNRKFKILTYYVEVEVESCVDVDWQYDDLLARGG